MGVKLKTEKILFVKWYIFLNIGKDCHYFHVVVKRPGLACGASVFGEDRIREAPGLKYGCADQCSDVCEA